VTIWRCAAPAKVNLYLHVGPPRADGRHPLDSLVVFADVGDEVTLDFTPASATDGTVSLTGPNSVELLSQLDPGSMPMASAPVDLWGANNRSGVYHFTLDKRLPIAAGLGGGTADTAAALRLANAAAGIGYSDAALARFAAAYGGDAPVCIASRPVLMRDDGARLDPAPTLPDLHAVLVNPNLPCSTAAVYRAFDAAGLGARFGEVAPPQAKTNVELIAALGHFRNDLEEPALTVQPAIADVLAALRARPQTQLARVTGSGATCFALTETPQAAQALAHDLAAAFPGWWVRAARLGAVDATPQPV
jgi:4-diphosphocytidyl-2-C-methyl-D-erythritol kinase